MENETKKRSKSCKPQDGISWGILPRTLPATTMTSFLERVWSANDKLSLHDRSLVTVTALIAQGLTDSSLQYHMATAKKNGVTREEMVQGHYPAGVLRRLAQSLGSFRYAKEVYGNE